MAKSFTARLAALVLRHKFKRPRSASAERILKQFDRQKAKGEQPYTIPKKIKIGSDVTKSSFCGMDVYTLCSGTQSNATVLYFTGSGYVHGPMKYHWQLCDKIAQRCNVKVIVPIYPLAPFHSYRDMYAVMTPFYIDYVASHPDEKIIFAGDSAGGGFALSFYEYAIEQSLQLPAKTLVICPWVDLATDNPDIASIAKRDPMLVARTARIWGELWADGEDVRNYMLSPLFYERLDKLSNVYISVGADDILYPDILLFFDKIKNNTNCTLSVGKQMNHDYPLYPEVIPEAKEALAEFLEQLKCN